MSSIKKTSNSSKSAGNSNASKLIYETSKEYVEDNYPEYQSLFDDIWELATSSAGGKSNRAPVEKNVSGLNFVGEGSIQWIINFVIPFISGVITSIVAEALTRRTNLSAEETVKIVEEKAGKIRINVKIDKKTAQDLLPYFLTSISKIRQESGAKQHLEDLLDDELRTVYKHILNDRELNDLLVHIQNAHPSFTSHGPDHSESVLTSLEKLLPKNLWKNFNALEILILLSSTRLHDIGMADFEGKLTECENENARRDLSNKLRKVHSSRSEKYLTEPRNYRRLLLEPGLAEIIGIICRAHVSEYDLMRLKPRWGPLRGYEKYGEVRIRLLAALLRLADACDLSYKRVKEVLVTVHNIPRNYVESVPHIEGALLVTGVLVRGTSIVIQAAPRNEEQVEWVRFLTNLLGEDFASVKSILKDRRTNGLKIPLDEVILETIETP